MHNVAHDRVDRGLVEAIAQIGQTMGIRTIAERVDSAEVLSRLADIGIEYAQGHHIAAPQPRVPGLITNRMLRHLRCPLGTDATWPGIPTAGPGIGCWGGERDDG